MFTETFLLLLAFVESGNKDIPAYEGPACGYHQEMPIIVKDANLILERKGFGSNFYSLDDRHDYYMSRSIAYVVLSHYKPIMEKKFKCKWNEYDALAFWFYGPSKWRPSSKFTNESKKRNKRFDYYKKQ